MAFALLIVSLVNAVAAAILAGLSGRASFQDLRRYQQRGETDTARFDGYLTQLKWFVGAVVTATVALVTALLAAIEFMSTRSVP